MGLKNLSSTLRMAAHECLKLCDLYVIDPDMPAKNLGLNIADIIVSAAYYGANIFCLWFAQVDWFVLLLNMLCLILAFIRTSIRQADCGKELLNIQIDDGFKHIYCVPYTKLAMIETFTFGVDFFAGIMLGALNNPPDGVICALRCGITLTIVITYLDGVMSNIQNMFQVYPRTIVPSA